MAYGSGTRRSPRFKKQRNTQLYIDRCCGRTYAFLAEKYKISAERARNICQFMAQHHRDI